MTRDNLRAADDHLWT